MRGKTAKRLRVYVSFLKEQDRQFPIKEQKFAQFTYKNMCRQVKRLWKKDVIFQEFIRNVVKTNQFI